VCSIPFHALHGEFATRLPKVDKTSRVDVSRMNRVISAARCRKSQARAAIDPDNQLSDLPAARAAARGNRNQS
jgi:hypothetical protein